MRKPRKTKAQRQYERQRRTLLRLAKTAVRWSIGSNTDDDGTNDGEALINSLTDLQAAADAYTESLSPRERRRMLK